MSADPRRLANEAMAKANDTPPGAYAPQYWHDVPALARALLEALDELAREKAERQADAIAYEGALGNPIPIDHNGKLSNGDDPKNFLAQFLREELDSLNGREPTQPLDTKVNLMTQMLANDHKKAVALDEISALVSERHGDDDSFSEGENEDKDLPVVITMKRIFNILDGGVYGRP